MWCIPKVDAAFVAAMEDVLDLYGETPDPKRPVVSFDEKRQVEQMLTLELRRNNGEIGEQSGKQSTKDVAR